MPAAKPELRAEALRLRIEERKSIREIVDETGASRGSVSRWLKGHPLTEDEVRERLEANGKRSAAVRAKYRDRDESPLHKMSRGRQLTKAEKGKVAEAAVLVRLVLRGHEVYGSPFDGDSTDWVVNVKGTLRRVQVKWARPQKYGAPQVVATCSSGRGKQRKFEEGELDFLVGYDLYTDTCFVWSWSEVQGKKTLACLDAASEAWHKLMGV